MAVQVVVNGLCRVYLDTGAANALEELGRTRNGADVTLESRFVDVPGDEFGGEEGPPVDVQYLGAIARVRLELTKFDDAVADKVRAVLYDGTAGTPMGPGTLVFQDRQEFRLLLKTVRKPMNFERAFPRQAVEQNKGTKFSTLVVEFECHEDDVGVLYNESIAESTEESSGSSES